nr:MAG TPA: hypothetical protein [Caudoviricetes sp.]
MIFSKLEKRRKNERVNFPEFRRSFSGGNRISDTQRYE